MQTRRTAAVAFVLLSIAAVSPVAARPDATRLRPHTGSASTQAPSTPSGEGGTSCSGLDVGERFVDVSWPEARKTITVSVPDMYCSWTAEVDVFSRDWLHVLGNPQGMGPGTVSILVSQYDGGSSFFSPCEARFGAVEIKTAGNQYNTSVTFTQYPPPTAECLFFEVINFFFENCSVSAAAHKIPDGSTSMRLARAYRDRVLARTERGRAYTRAYYDHTAEVTRILSANPRLGFRAARLLEHLTPALRSVLDGGRAEIGAADLDAIDRFLDEVGARSGADLRMTIDAIRRDMYTPAVRAELGVAVAPGGSLYGLETAAVRDSASDRAIRGQSIPSSGAVLAAAARGRNLARIATEHGEELLDLLSRRPALMLAIAGHVDRYRAILSSLVETGEARIEPDDLAAIESLFASVDADASPELGAAIRAVRRELRDPSALADYGLHAEPRSEPSADAATRRIADVYARLPLTFEHGGSDAFVARGRGYRVDLRPTGASVALERRTPAPERVAVSMRLAGARANARCAPEAPASTEINTFRGRDRAAWRTSEPAYSRIRYAGVYPGVDVVYYGTQSRLEYDFIVAPGAETSAIRLAFDAPVTLDSAGNLVLGAGAPAVAHRAPVVYQEVDGERRKVEAQYRIVGAREVGFALGAYDPMLPLVIDPVVDYATFLGGAMDDTGNGVAVDAEGNVYVAGYTAAADFPVSNAVQSGFGGGPADAFVAKMNAEGTALVYATYLGGSREDFATGIAVDADGNVYVAGSTNSTNFPVAGAAQANLRGAYGGFLAKLDATGAALVYATYLGGSGFDVATAVAIGADRSAYVAGSAFSANLGTVGAYSRTNRGRSDAFVVKVRPDGAAIDYATYLGGSGYDEAASVAVDPAGNAYVAGITSSSDFPVRSAADPAFGGLLDGFVAKLDAAGATLVYGTFLGGSEPDGALAIAVAADGSAYVTGATASEDFPLAGAFQSGYGGGMLDGFVARLAPDGASLAYASYFGGSDDDRGYGIILDAAGRAVVTGLTASTDFPTRDPLQAELSGDDYDAVVLEVSATGGALDFSTYLGGAGSDSGIGVAAAPDGRAVVLGLTNSADFPTALALQPAVAGRSDAFVAKIATAPPVPPPVVDRVSLVDRPNKPFRVKLSGSNFQQGVAVSIGGTPWSGVKRKSDATLVLKKGAALEELFPAGEAVEILLVNPDGGVGRVTVTRN